MALCVFTVNTQCVVSINEKALNGTPYEIVFETNFANICNIEPQSQSTLGPFLEDDSTCKTCFALLFC